MAKQKRLINKAVVREGRDVVHVYVYDWNAALVNNLIFDSDVFNSRDLYVVTVKETLRELRKTYPLERYSIQTAMSSSTEPIPVFTFSPAPPVPPTNLPEVSTRSEK